MKFPTAPSACLWLKCQCLTRALKVACLLRRSPTFGCPRPRGTEAIVIGAVFTAEGDQDTHARTHTHTRACQCLLRCCRTSALINQVKQANRENSKNLSSSDCWNEIGGLGPSMGLGPGVCPNSCSVPNNQVVAPEQLSLGREGWCCLQF